MHAQHPTAMYCSQSQDAVQAPLNLRFRSCVSGQAETGVPEMMLSPQVCVSVRFGEKQRFRFSHSLCHLKLTSRCQFLESVLMILILNIKSDNPKRSLLEGNGNIYFFLLSIRIDLLDSFQMTKYTNA